MRRSDRLARLHELLARVQRNTAERRGNVAISSLARGAEIEPNEQQPAPVLRADREPIPPPPSSRGDLGSDPDDWSSLLTRELADPNPLAEVSEETSFPSLVPPEPPPISEPSALHAGVSEPALAAAAEEPLEPAPESQLEHAMRIAAEQRPQPQDPGALWLEAAEELRERRSTLPPEDEEAPAAEPEPEPEPVHLTPEPATTTPIPSRRSVRPIATEPHGDTPTPIATFETTHTAAPRVSESVSPPPMSRRRRALRPSPAPIVMGEQPADRPTPYWAVVLLGCGVGLLFTLAYIALRALDQPRGAVADDRRSTTAQAAMLPPASAVLATTAQVPGPSASIPIVEIASSGSSEAPLPPITRPKDMGLLWVDAPSPVTVYVQGLEAGANGTYLEVPCGLKNVRLARRDLPPPGHSFPMWLGKAESVLVPCGAANRVKMSSE